VDERPVVLEARHLRKVYAARHGGDARVAVADMSLVLSEGGALGIVGESGSGKTTVAKMLVGLEVPSGGEVLIGGVQVPARRLRRAERKQRARHVQLVFQDPYSSLDPRQTVGGSLSEVLKLHFRLPSEERRERVSLLLDQVGLDQELAKRRPKQLSGGQRQRVAIARALASQPATLVLDEAVASLDVSVQAQILNLLSRLRKETRTALVFISHDLAVVSHVTDYLYVMYRGTVVEQGDTDHVLTNPSARHTRELIDSIPRRGWSPSHILSEELRS
jgi:ABC-type oligopeptide transport system ATPase subunit